MNEFSKLLNRRPSIDSDSEIFTSQDYNLTPPEKMQIQAEINRREVAHLCQDISSAIMAYCAGCKKISPLRQQDITTLNAIALNPWQCNTKEECLRLLYEKIDRLETGMFNKESRLQTMLYHVLAIHESEQLKIARADLLSELLAYKVLHKKYTAIRGEEMLRFKIDLATKRQDYAVDFEEEPAEVASKSRAECFSRMFMK